MAQHTSEVQSFFLKSELGRLPLINIEAYGTMTLRQRLFYSCYYIEG